MKNLIILLLLAGIATGHAQVIQLDEARVSNTAKIISEGDLKYLVVEDYSGHFMKNPIAFMKENFDAQSLVEQMKGDKYESFVVEFRNKKGYLQANFDGKGNLVSTAQRFKNIAIPLAVGRELVRDYKGWSMTKNLYIASGREDAIDKELYKVTLQNGKSSQTVKITPTRPSRGLASN